MPQSYRVLTDDGDFAKGDTVKVLKEYKTEYLVALVTSKSAARPQGYVAYYPQNHLQLIAAIKPQ